MDTCAEHDTEICPEHPEVYEPPMLDEIGGFTALTRAAAGGSVVDRFGYYTE
jgi:hypothetical protein